MIFVIVRDGRVIWRGSSRSTCIRLAPAFGGVASVELFGEIVPITEA